MIGRLTGAFGGGALIGTLGGLIGLGGAEFRLPLLISSFRFAALQAVILNKAMSLIVVATALIFRTRTVPLDDLAAHWTVVVNLLGGSLIGAWFGAGWATRLKSASLYRVIAILLVVIALVLLWGMAPPDRNRFSAAPARSSRVSWPGSQSVWWLRCWVSREANC